MLEKKWNINVPNEFLTDNDCYIIKGKKYLRVTRVKSIINQPGLNAWRGKVGNLKANEIMRESAKRGTYFHKLSEQMLKGNDVDIDNYDIKDLLGLFKKTVNEYNIKAEETEQVLVDEELKIGGKTDFIGFFNSDKLGKNAHVIIDWKTSAGIYEDYWIQIAAYVFTFEKLTKIKLDGAAIFQFKDGKVNIEERTRDELKEYYNMFIHCLELYKFFNKR